MGERAAGQRCGHAGRTSGCRRGGAAPAAQWEGEQAGEKKEMEADARARARGTNGLISKIETKSFAVSKIHKMFIGAR